MQRLFALVVIIAVCVAGLGFYRGWFNLSTEGSDHETDMTISVDRAKIRGDEEKVENSVRDLGKKPTEKIGAGSAAEERHHDEP